jgi:cob(I)alamin adenosyltransferase
MGAGSERGLVIVFTGDGKGKTCAALGQAVRAVGRGLRVLVVQFLKARASGEHKAARRLAPDLEIRVMGRGFVPPPEDPAFEEHRAAARAALQYAREMLRSGERDMLVADEILTAVGLKVLAEEDVLALLDDRPAGIHLLLTGRGATERLVARADLVTEMHSRKHPHDQGAEAQEGVEF